MLLFQVQMMRLHAQFEDEEHALNRMDLAKVNAARRGSSQAQHHAGGSNAHRGSTASGHAGDHAHGHPGHPGHGAHGEDHAGDKRHSFDRAITGADAGKAHNPIFANPIAVAALEPGHDIRHMKFSGAAHI
jgi:hypothetical protein